jgi:uncharacterized protein (DUF427 family)
MSRRKSLYHQYPDYRVDLAPSSERIRVRWRGKLLADSTRTLDVLETNLGPVVYFPREDVDFSVLERTGHETFCPFKGEASYWSLDDGGEGRDENAVWSYEDPFDEVAGLKDYVAFYADRVEWER